MAMIDVAVAFFAVAVAVALFAVAVAVALFAVAVAVAVAVADIVGCAIAGTIAGIVAGIAGIVGMFVPVVVVVAGLLLEIVVGMLVAGVVVGMLVHKVVGMLVHRLVGMFVAVVAGSIGAAVVVVEAGMALMSLLQSCSEASYTLTGPMQRAFCASALPQSLQATILGALHTFACPWLTLSSTSNSICIPQGPSSTIFLPTPGHPSRPSHSNPPFSTPWGFCHLAHHPTPYHHHSLHPPWLLSGIAMPVENISPTFLQQMPLFKACQVCWRSLF